MPLFKLYRAAALCSAAAFNISFAQCHNDGRFSVNSDQQTVLDTLTGLMWQQCPMGLSGADCETGEVTTLSFRDAQSAAISDTTGTYTDWRLPTVKELSSLVDVRCYAPSIPADVFPNTPAHYFWTDIKFNDDQRKAWVVSFYFGEDGVAYDSLKLHARLVREASPEMGQAKLTVVMNH